MNSGLNYKTSSSHDGTMPHRTCGLPRMKWAVHCPSYALRGMGTTSGPGKGHRQHWELVGEPVKEGTGCFFKWWILAGRGLLTLGRAKWPSSLQEQDFCRSLAPALFPRPVYEGQGPSFAELSVLNRNLFLISAQTVSQSNDFTRLLPTVQSTAPFYLA